MAFHWRADDGPTLNAGLVVLRISGIRSSIAKGSGPPAPSSGSAHGTGQCIHLLRYTENPFYRAHRLLYDTLHTFYRMHKFLN